MEESGPLLRPAARPERQQNQGQYERPLGQNPNCLAGDPQELLRGQLEVLVHREEVPLRSDVRRRGVRVGRFLLFDHFGQFEYVVALARLIGLSAACR